MALSLDVKEAEATHRQLTLLYIWQGIQSIPIYCLQNGRGFFCSVEPALSSARELALLRVK